MSQVNKRTRYFLITVIFFGIIPLLVMRVSGSKKKAEAVKIINEIPQIENIYKEESKKVPVSFVEKNISFKANTKVVPLSRDPFSQDKAINYLIVSQNDFDSESSVNNSGNINASNNIELKGIVIDGESKYSILNGRILEEGDDINGMTVISIKSGKVVIGNDSSTYSLSLND